MNPQPNLPHAASLLIQTTSQQLTTTLYPTPNATSEIYFSSSSSTVQLNLDQTPTSQPNLENLNNTLLPRKSKLISLKSTKTLAEALSLTDPPKLPRNKTLHNDHSSTDLPPKYSSLHQKKQIRSKENMPDGKYPLAL